MALFATQLLVAASARGATPEATRQRFPNVLVLSIDTLRADRLSAYGYHRATSPAIDRLLASGARFTEARTPEPLTQPAMASLWTGLSPHRHGATRNGLRVRPGLASLPKILGERGYQTIGIVGGWPLAEKISGLGGHFREYLELFERKRWLGLFLGEATAEQLTDEALDALKRQRRGRPFLLWVHYVEPHAPYRFHEEFAARLGLPKKREISRSDRYDSEIAFADRHVGRLLAAVSSDPTLAEDTIVVFLADHGESLGEQGDWGHGRHLPEVQVRIPLAIAWPGRIAPSQIPEPASTLDIAPTILALAGLAVPATLQGLEGFDWSPVLLRRTTPPPGRRLFLQAHRGAVLSAEDARQARRRGLLEIAAIEKGFKTVLRLDGGRARSFDLSKDPAELHPLPVSSTALAVLREWLHIVEQGLIANDDQPVALDVETIERLKSLGYTH